MSINKEQVLLEVQQELQDYRTIGRTHGRASTYLNEGCRGPLCKHAMRVLSRAQRVGSGPGRSQELEAFLQPILDEHWADQSFEPKEWPGRKVSA